MDRRQIGLILVLEKLGLPLKLETFDDRLILQKAVYLADAAGVHLGYDHGWYLRGPYSPGLTRDAFAAVAELPSEKDEIRGWQLDEESQLRLESLRRLIPITDACSLELLASVHYLVRRRGMHRDDPGLLAKELHELGKDYDVETVRQALKTLQANGLL